VAEIRYCTVFISYSSVDIDGTDFFVILIEKLEADIAVDNSVFLVFSEFT